MNRATPRSPATRLTAGRAVCFLTALGLATTTTTGCAGSSSPGSNELAEGEALYTSYCVSCHGPQGDGRGTAAYLLFPKPRNFQRAQFKLRSTAEGKLPTDEDLIRTVSEGIPGTSMFSFAGLLTEAELRAVVEHVKSLTPAFADAAPISPGDLLDIPSAPEPTGALIAAGKLTYERFRCAQCHGPEGRGDGPSAPTLRDSEGDPFPAADFTYGIYRSGGTPEALYRTFLNGMAGTPMPSFAAAIQSDEEAWGLVYYVLSLAPGGAAQAAKSDPGPVSVANVDDATRLSDPSSSEWDAVAPHRVALRPLWYRNDYPPVADIRVARADGQLAVLVEWRDVSHNAEALRTEDFPDGVALQFALVDPPPFVGMGHADPGGHVEIWYWRGDRQAALDRGATADLTSVYPDTTADDYPFVDSTPSGAPIATARRFSGDEEAPFAPGRDVGNAVSNPQLLVQPVHSLAASGFGTLTSRPADRMRAAGSGAWADGVYRVVFSAPLRPQDAALEVDFTAGRVPMALAIWNGAAGDRNGTKLVSQWVMVELGPGEEADE